MKLLIGLLLCASLWGAVGDITAVRILGTTCTANASMAGACDGWTAEIDIEQTGVGGTPTTGGAYHWGWDANNRPTAPAVVFTVTQPGFDGAGNATTYTETVYGQWPLRQPYSNQAVMDERAAAGTLTVTVVLSKRVYVSDTVTATMLVNAYCDDGATCAANHHSNAVTGIAVTNQSTKAYPKPVANWDGVQSRLVIGNTLTLSAFGASVNAANGTPLAAMQFYATDASAHTANVVVSTLRLTTGMAQNFAHYEGTINTSGFHQGDLVTANFKAYPRIGDAAAVFDTNDNAALGENTFRPAPIFYVFDAAGTYGRSYAYVDPGGNNTSCAAYATAGDAAANPCQTIGQAEVVTRNFNNTNYSRQNLANSIIYVNAGTYASVGLSSFTYSATGDTATWWLMASPGTAAASVIINYNGTANSSRLWGKYVTISGVTLAQDANASIFTTPTAGNPSIRVQDCILTGDVSYTTNILDTANFGRSELIRNTYTNVRNPMGYWSVGNRLTNFYTLNYIHTFIGNYADTAGTTAHTAGVAILRESTICTGTSGTSGSADNGIIYNNKFVNLQDTWFTGASGSPPACNYTIGLIILQNDVENMFTTASGYLIGISADGSTTSADNVLFALNTTGGNRSNLAYNDSGTAGTPQTNWEIRGNMVNYLANKNDIFPTANGNRVGGWPIAMGNGLMGNVGTCSASCPFVVEFAGWQGVDSSTALTGGFVNDQSRLGGGAGYGDYRLLSNSPGVNRIPAGECILPYDLDLLPRNCSGYGSAGAHDEAPRRTQVFSW